MKPLSSADVALSKSPAVSVKPSDPRTVKDVMGRPVAVWTGPTVLVK